jgi:hypothetical protein
MEDYMQGYSNKNIFTQYELEAHRTAVTLVERLPEIEGLRCHELTRAVATILRTSPLCSLRIDVVDGKFGLVDHSWIVFSHNPYRYILLDVYAVGSVPVVQLHDMGSISIRDARTYTEGPTRDDIDSTMVTHVLDAWKPPQRRHSSSPL